MRSMAAATCSISRKRWTLRGQLQGVGFRPFVYRIARELHLDGFVRNDSSHVTIEAQGSTKALEKLAQRLTDEAPALAEIAEIQSEAIETVEGEGFEIRESQADADGRATVTVDTAVCADCVRELRDESDFRCGYPLINCTNCGPRYSIIRAMPYDRSNTTMSAFALCEKCHQQYLSPADRRFHAQPVACDDCGPRVGLYVMTADACDWRSPIARAAQLIRDGKIVAVKGIGGFHLACRADDELVVAELRRRKHRDAKPFAVMCPDVKTARGLVALSKEGERTLTSPVAPVVLSQAKIGNRQSEIASSVAMGNHRLGVMVPYTPVHHLLFGELAKLGFVGALVMTSANLTDEPLVKDNEEAIARLKGIADAILLHERDIERSIDDSVVIDMGEGEKVLPIRRARGYVPGVVVLSRHEGTKARRHEEEAIPCSVDNRKSKIENSQGLCVGGELKNTVAVVRGDEVILSHHLGDLKHTLSYEYFRKAIEDLCTLFEVRPEWIAHDMHPAYLSTQWAKELGQKWGVPLIPVQHHHAHAAAVLAEHGVNEKALAIVCDGVGYGVDGSAWGGELLLVKGSEMSRLGHLRAIPLAGGDAAARDTRRCAAGVMWEMGQGVEGLFAEQTEAAVVTAMLNSGRNVAKSTAAGRLFDAVACVLGVCNENTHEAQAAMALESLAHGCGPMHLRVAGLRSEIGRNDSDITLDLLPVVLELKRRREAGENVGRLAMEFHDVFARVWADAALKASAMTGIKTIGLSGGVFCNEILTKRLTELLGARGMRVLRHEIVPPNDGGIALGQAAIARCQ